jgi:hypothetical protein
MENFVPIAISLNALVIVSPSSDVEHDSHMAQWLRLVNSKKHCKAKKVHKPVVRVYILKHRTEWLEESETVLLR